MRAARFHHFIATLVLVITMDSSTESSGREDQERFVPAAAQDLHRVHTSEQFAFLAHARRTDLFPLFGAEKERVWAPGWEPRFVWPSTPADRTGMVFQISHGDKIATWVNTVLDPAAGQIQYVYVLPEIMVTVITLSLHSEGADTEVTVLYDRTSLAPEYDAVVKKLADDDRVAGRRWARQINAYLFGSGTR